MNTRLLLSQKEVEQIYGIRQRTLERWRLSGHGPRWKKLSGEIGTRGRGIVKYDVRDIEAWLGSRPGGGACGSVISASAMS